MATIGNTFLAVRVAQSFAADVRSAAFHKIQKYSFGNLDKFQTGQLIVRLTSDVNSVQMMVMMGLRMFIRAPIMIVGSIILMFLINAELAKIVLLLLPFTLLLAGVFVWKAQPMFLEVQRRLDKLNTVLQENLAGVRVVKAFVRQDHEAQRFENANVDLTKQINKGAHNIRHPIPLDADNHQLQHPRRCLVRGTRGNRWEVQRRRHPSLRQLPSNSHNATALPRDDGEPALRR